MSLGFRKCKSILFSIGAATVLTAVNFLIAPICSAQEQPSVPFAVTLQSAQDESKAEHWPAAARLWQEIVDANPVNPDYARSLAYALYQVKDYRHAIVANQRALDMGSSSGDFPWSIAYDIACEYALLGEKQQALDWLDRSWKTGWRDLESAQQDDDLKSLRDDPHFHNLTALVDTAKMDRVTGWRFDLHLLAREIERRHYAPFRETSRADFVAAVNSLDQAIPTLQDNQIITGFMKILALVNDGHSAFAAAAGPAAFRMSVPLQFYEFEEGFFITWTDAEHRDLLGSQILRIGDHTPTEVLAALAPLIGRENSMRLKLVGAAYMRRPPILNGLGLLPSADVLPLRIRKPGGNEENVSVAANVDLPRLTPDAVKDWVSYPSTTGKALPLYLKNQQPPYWFEYLADSKTLYFQFNAVANDKSEPFDKFVERLFAFAHDHEVSKFVIDMRSNGGGNTFLVPPLIHALIRSDDLNQPGKLFVVIGRTTYSAAMNTLDFLERNTNAIFVGEPSGSSPNFIGESAAVKLPYSKLSPSISDLYWETSWPMDHRLWIAPTLYAPPTFAMYSQNRDPAMEAIMAYQTKSVSDVHH